VKHPVWLAYVAIVSASLLGASGQLLLSAGASGNRDFIQYFNGRIAAGLLLYALGTIAWIFALSRLPLSIVYAFTALTFILVYLGSAAMLQEPLPVWPRVGVALVAAGFLIIAFSSRRIE
jgi:drug/metabolite transporter (DMT)-like permease